MSGDKEDSLSGKLVIKAQLGQDIRRIAIHNEDITFDELILMMQRVFRSSLSTQDQITLKYKDEDGDLVTIVDNCDVSQAVLCSRVLRLKVIVPEENEQSVDSLRAELLEIRSKVDGLLEKSFSLGPLNGAKSDKKTSGFGSVSKPEMNGDEIKPTKKEVAAAPPSMPPAMNEESGRSSATPSLPSQLNPSATPIMSAPPSERSQTPQSISGTSGIFEPASQPPTKAPPPTVQPQQQGMSFAPQAGAFNPNVRPQQPRHFQPQQQMMPQQGVMPQMPAQQPNQGVASLFPQNTTPTPRMAQVAPQQGYGGSQPGQGPPANAIMQSPPGQMPVAPPGQLQQHPGAFHAHPGQMPQSQMMAGPPQQAQQAPGQPMPGQPMPGQPMPGQQMPPMQQHMPGQTTPNPGGPPPQGGFQPPYNQRGLPGHMSPAPNQPPSQPPTGPPPTFPQHGTSSPGNPYARSNQYARYAAMPPGGNAY